MADTGWVSATTAADGGTDWGNPSNALASDDNYATSATFGWIIPGSWLRLSGFGLSIPSNATITQVAIQLEGYYATGAGIYAPDSGGLVLNKNVTTDPTAYTGWLPPTSYLGSTEAVLSQTYNVGSVSTSGSNLSTWTPSDFNGTNFGISFQAPSTTSNFPAGGVVSVILDQAQLKITYTVPPPAANCSVVNSFLMSGVGI